MCFTTLQKNKDVSILVLRLAIAGIFLVHGYMKWQDFETAAPLFKLLAVVEPLGGIAMLIGLLTRWAGTGLGIIMLGAIYMKMGNVGLTGFAGQGGWEFDALILASCIMIMTTGAGKYSVDARTGWDKA